MQAERAVEALAQFLPAQAKVVRDGQHQIIEARRLVPGDLLLIEEGDRISADVRLLSGGIEVDASMLTGELMPVFRAAELYDRGVPLLQARELVFSGTVCTEGEGRGVVYATGMKTELGRIAALSEQLLGSTLGVDPHLAIPLVDRRHPLEHWVEMEMTEAQRPVLLDVDVRSD